MSKYTAIQALGEAAKGAGSAFGIIAAQKVRAERLAEARAGKLEDMETQRKWRLEDREYLEGRQDAKAAEALDTQKQLIDYRAVVAAEHAVPGNPDFVKGGDGYFYAKTPTGLQRTDVRHTTQDGASSKTATERTLEMRMRSASAALGEMEELESGGYDPTGVGGLRDQWTAGSGVANWLASSEGQRYQTAAKRVKEAFLRTATGAAAPESENSAYVGMFIPSFGDTAQTKEAKKRAIREQIAAMADASNSDLPQDLANAHWRESAEEIARRNGLVDAGRGASGSWGTPTEPQLSPAARRYLP